MLVDTVDYNLEQFTITFLNVSDKAVTLAMVWDNVAATATIELAK